jgi:hypothetical protein
LTPNPHPHPHPHPYQGSAISWTPNAAKLASEVGVKLASYSEDWYGNPVDVVEMDGAVDKLEEIIYLESQVRPCHGLPSQLAALLPYRPHHTHPHPAPTIPPSPCPSPCPSHPPPAAPPHPPPPCPPTCPPTCHPAFTDASTPNQMCNTGTKFYGELTEQIVKNKDAPGSDNGTGLMQTLCSFKIREVYEKLTK